MGFLSGKILMKFLLIVTNIFVVVAGIAMIVVGCLIHKLFNNVKDVFDKVSSMNWIPITVIFIGCVIFVVGFCGFCGAIAENRCMLMTFAVFMFVFFILQLIIAIVFATMSGKVNTIVNKNVMAFFEREYSVSGKSKAFDFLQTEFKCCGVNGPNDYSQFPDMDDKVPSSCCIKDGATVASETTCTPYKDGCLQKATNSLKRGVKMAIGIGFGVAAIELLAVIIACCLSGRIKDMEGIA